MHIQIITLLRFANVRKKNVTLQQLNSANIIFLKKKKKV